VRVHCDKSIPKSARGRSAKEISSTVEEEELAESASPSLTQERSQEKCLRVDKWGPGVRFRDNLLSADELDDRWRKANASGKIARWKLT